MDIVTGILTNTPVWVYVLFGYLVFRGAKAMQPGETTLLKLAIIPVALTVWGLSELLRLFEPDLANLSAFGLALLLGLCLGIALVGRLTLKADRARGTIARPADYTLLPLVLLTFGVKYTFGVLAVVSPEALQTDWLRLADLGASGFFVGVFIGKFAAYALAYTRAGRPARAAG